MSTSPLKLVTGTLEGQANADPAAAHAVAAWLSLLGRALKTCRLYDGANPIVVRFREELASSLGALHARHGSIPLTVGSHAFLYGEYEVHPAQSRDDQLAGVLHRDGIRRITFEPGMDSRQMDALLDQILRVTGPSAGDEDLVTLLWEANLPHVRLETVPLEGEADGGGEGDAEQAPSLAFPRQERGAVAPPAGSAGQGSDVLRSEDWSTGEGSDPVEQAFDALQETAELEMARFRRECEATAAEPIVAAALRIIEDCFADELCPSDRQELLEVIPRVLREALSGGDWYAASVALGLLRQCEPAWSVKAFGEGLCGPFAITTRRVIESLDHQDSKQVQAFLELARRLGPEISEWLMQVLAESEQMRVRRPLARTIAELLADAPERLSPWARDERWYVVRNVVHILGWIGGDRIASQLEAVASHPEPRVRREVVAALADVDRDRSRPILIRMLAAAEAGPFGAILHQLGLDPHASVAETLLELFRREDFSNRSDDERRSLFLALATRGDVVVPTLETALHAGGLFSRRPEADRRAIALCLARIGSADARAVLERGLRSKNGSVRNACMIAAAPGEKTRE